jgi:hypothetical protein
MQKGPDYILIRIKITTRTQRKSTQEHKESINTGTTKKHKDFAWHAQLSNYQIVKLSNCPHSFFSFIFLNHTPLP